MSSFAYGKELVDILSFVEIISLKDIKDYWRIDDEINLVEFKKLKSIEIHYDSDELHISDENLRSDMQSLETAKEFIVFLMRNKRLSRTVARKVVAISESYAIFDPDNVLNLLYIAEEYKKCLDYYSKHIPVFESLTNAQSIFVESLSKVGSFVDGFDVAYENIDLALAILRYLWQKGDFSSAKKICNIIEERADELDPIQKCHFLNNKIRVLRDMGGIQETDALLTKFEKLLGAVAQSNLPLYNDLKGKYLYNQSINCYIKGEFSECIAFCEQSLKLRTDNYTAPYILLREARCFVFQGKPRKYNSLIKSIHIDQSDNWAQALLLTVKSEYNRFVLDNPDEANRLLEKANATESLNGADTVYTDIALLYSYVQCNKKTDISRYKQKMKKYKKYIDGEIAARTACIALEAIDGNPVDDNILNLYKDYDNYPVYLFVSLFSLAKLFEKRDIPFPLSVDSLTFGAEFSKKLLSAFSKKPRVLIIYSWWDEFGNEDSENKNWVKNLNAALRMRGICSFIDETCTDNTTDSTKLIQPEDYDKFIVVLTVGFKKRVEQKEGIIYTEYKELLDILTDSPNKIIFVSKADNDSISPVEIKSKLKINLTHSNLKRRNDKELSGLVRKIRNIPYYDTGSPLVDEDLTPEPISFV